MFEIKGMLDFSDLEKTIEGLTRDYKKMNLIGVNEVKYIKIEEDGFYLLKFNLVGIDKKDINVSVNAKQELVISYDVEKTDFSPNKLKQTVHLSNDSDVENIDVTMENGVLQVKVPKKQYDRKIEVK